MIHWPTFEDHEYLSISVYKTCCEHCNDMGQSITTFTEAMLSVDESSCHRSGKMSTNRPIVLPNHPNRSPNLPALSPNRIVTELVSWRIALYPRPSMMPRCHHGHGMGIGGRGYDRLLVR